MWQPGDQIVVRYWTSGQLSGAIPVTVVEDTTDFVAYYLAAGTPTKYPIDVFDESALHEGKRGGTGSRPWQITDGEWHTNGRLYIVPAYAAHAFSLFWRAADWAFLGWYVDLQAPLRRIPQGFESEDYALDIVVEPDGSWTWKDEDEFAAAQQAGRFSPEDVAAIRTEAERVIETVEAQRWPFNAGWEQWRPEDSWTVPTIPPDWDLESE